MVSLAFLAAYPLGTQAQAPARPTVRISPYRARILGVFDDATGEPIDSVRVTDLRNGNSSMTTRTGTVSLWFLPDGGGLIRLQKIGFAAQILFVAISPTDTASITFTLQRLTQLAPVVTTAGAAPSYISPALRSFEERRKSGFGHFIGDSVLRANDGRPLANVIASRLPEIITKPGRSSGTFLMQAPRCVSGGPPQVYLDGIALSADIPIGYSVRSGSLDELPFNLANFDVHSLAGVEWYPDGASVPSEFNHISGRCGALLLWTRER